jgi:hypothetical protein
MGAWRTPGMPHRATGLIEQPTSGGGYCSASPAIINAAPRKSLTSVDFLATRHEIPFRFE